MKDLELKKVVRDLEHELFCKGVDVSMQQTRIKRYKGKLLRAEAEVNILTTEMEDLNEEIRVVKERFESGD